MISPYVRIVGTAARTSGSASIRLIICSYCPNPVSDRRDTTMSPVSPWNCVRNISSHPPMTLITTNTMAVQSITAMSDTQAMRRFSKYFLIR